MIPSRRQGIQVAGVSSPCPLVTDMTHRVLAWVPGPPSLSCECPPSHPRVSQGNGATRQPEKLLGTPRPASS